MKRFGSYEVSEISLGVAFTAGLLSFLSPCVLPLVPVYLASLAGPEIFETGNKHRFHVFFHSLSFVLGFIIVFILIGAGFGLTGLALSAHIIFLREISGGLLIFFGLFLLVSQWVPWLNFEKRLKPSAGKATGYTRSMLVGGLFTFAWTPCVGPILGAILTLAMGSGTAANGALLLAIYSLGLGLPFIAIGAAFETVSPLLKRVSRAGGLIYAISGVLLVAVGILIITGKLVWIQGGF